MLPKVSIIVPIYNVEKYLKQCVNSLVHQTLKEIEIILVEDGAKDRSGEIVDDYKNKYENVKAIHQENAGLGAARNRGIEHAVGEYIAFVDGDDWVRSDMYEKLYIAAKQNSCDIVVSGHCDYKNGIPVVVKKHPFAGKVFRTGNELDSVRKNLFGHCPEDQTVEAFPMSVCMSLYKRDMIERFHLRFATILSEDTIFNIYAYKCANAIAFMEYTDYCYRKEEQASITNSFSENKKTQFKEFLLILKNLAEKEKESQCKIRAKRMAIDYCRFYVGIVDGAKLTRKEKKRYIREFAEDKELRKCWEDYPIQTLPIQQKIFHNMLIHQFYGCVLFMNRIRKQWKKS